MNITCLWVPGKEDSWVQVGGHRNPLRCPGQEEAQVQAEAGKPLDPAAKPLHSQPAPTLHSWEPREARSSWCRAPRQASRTGSRSNALPSSRAAPALPPHAPPPACKPSLNPPASAALAPVAAAAGGPEVAAAHPVAAGGRPATPHGLPHLCHKRSSHGCLTWPTHRLRHPGAGSAEDSQWKADFKSSSRLLGWGARPTPAPARPGSGSALQLYGPLLARAGLGSRSGADRNSRSGWRCGARDQKILSGDATAQSQGGLLAACPGTALGDAGQLLNIWRFCKAGGWGEGRSTDNSEILKQNQLASCSYCSMPSRHHSMLVLLLA